MFFKLLKMLFLEGFKEKGRYNARMIKSLFSLVLILNWGLDSTAFAAMTKETIERRIEFIKAYIENQDKILNLSEKIPSDYPVAGAAFLKYGTTGSENPEAVALNDLEVASLFYSAAMSSFDLAKDFYQQVDACNKVNDRYKLFLPISKRNGDPENTCEFSDAEKAKFPGVIPKSVCQNMNYICEPNIDNFAEYRDQAGHKAQTVANRSDEQYFYLNLFAFSSDWIERSLENFHVHCHPQYPKCTNPHCFVSKWGIKVTEDHDKACLMLKEMAEKQNILLKEKGKKSKVDQPYFPLIFAPSQANLSGDYVLDERFLALQVKKRNYYLYSPLLRGGNWLALAETLYEKNQKAIEEMEKQQVKNPVLQKFRQLRLRTQDKRISTQEVLDRARFKFNIDDYVRNF